LYNKALSALLIPAALLLSGCARQTVESLRMEDLFDMSLGRMEDQIDLFQVPGAPFNRQNRVYLKDARVYIVNGNASKVMEFTPYGDLIFLLYDTSTNPPPVSLSQGEAELSNRIAQGFAFRNIGSVVVDGKKRLYIEDEVPRDQRVYDEELETVYSKRILRFDARGQLIDFFGQEGLGGTPFPYIQSIHITASDELVVVTRTGGAAWLVFWYSQDGSLLYRVEIDSEHLPNLEDYIPNLTHIVPDIAAKELLLMIVYYEEQVNPVTNTQDSVNLAASRLYHLDLNTESYGRFVEVPRLKTGKESLGLEEGGLPPPSYEFLGTAQQGYAFFIRPEERNQYDLLILGREGGIVARRYLTIDESELTYMDLHLSERGILSGLLALPDKVRVVWWRSDSLLEESGG
jgi:hypothetical protein